MLVVQEMERGVSFYRDMLSLDMKYHTAEWSKLALGDSIIALQGGGNDTFIWTGVHFEVQDIQDECLRVQEGEGCILS